MRINDNDSNKSNVIPFITVPSLSFSYSSYQSSKKHYEYYPYNFYNFNHYHIHSSGDVFITSAIIIPSAAIKGTHRHALTK